MDYKLLHEVLALVEEFEKTSENTADVSGFKRWITASQQPAEIDSEPQWENKLLGRSADSMISTLLVHMNRYAKTYSRAAIHGSSFSSQEDFIYLINLKAMGGMTKMQLINRNIHDKPTGMQIVNRLIRNGWVVQNVSETDRRSKNITITKAGLEILERQMNQIRLASTIVTGKLTHAEKMELIRLLNKLNDFHNPIFMEHVEPAQLLQRVNDQYFTSSN